MTIINQITINASPQIVFSWLDDPERARQWMTSVKEYRIINETQEIVGTSFTEYIEEDGQGIEMNGVITHFAQDKLFGVHLESKYNAVDVKFSLREIEGCTKLTQQVNIHFKGVATVLSFLGRSSIKKKIKNQSMKELSRLKQLCED